MKYYFNKNIVRYLIITIIATAFILISSQISSAEIDNSNLNSNANTNQEELTNQSDPNNTEPIGEPAEAIPSEEVDEDVLDLNGQIQERKQTLEELQKQYETYKKNIAIKQQETLTLKTQLTNLDDQITKTTLEIQITEAEIDTLKLQIQDVKNKIADREKQILDQKSRLAELIRQLNTHQDKNLLEILLKENRFSNFFNQINYLEEIEHYLKKSLDEVKELKTELEGIQSNLETKELELFDKKEKLDVTKVDLDSQANYKTKLLDDTQSSEASYQELIEAVKQEQISVNAEISIIEETIRNKLEGSDLLDADDSKTLSWPASPVKGISAYFHDPTYIFRKLFEHPAIDIRAKQGTSVKAAASGYVARAKDAGLGYSYVMIIHANSLSTVYGHLSSIKVEEESYVTRGQIIGLSGGMPGTAGAGRLTTGPHLHFEVRLDGIPVNPLDYLP